MNERIYVWASHEAVVKLRAKFPGLLSAAKFSDGEKLQIVVAPGEVAIVREIVGPKAKIERNVRYAGDR